MEKLKMHSPNLTALNIEKIKALFPNCVTESTDESGNLKLAVDFDQLRQELSDSIVEGPQERYHLNWPGKREALLTANAPIAKTLRPAIDESVDFENTKNLFIEGDNLEALKLLQETYLGKVKMIYIDPPYNTGNDFVYEDDFAESAEEFLKKSNQKDEKGNHLVANSESNGRFHSDWLTMIYPRLKLARNLLADDGVIFVSIDYHENANLRTIMDEVFGSLNFIGEIYWESKTKSQNTSTSFDKLQPKAEMIMAFTKHSKKRFNLITKGSKDYPMSDEQGEYREYPLEVMNASGIRGRETMIYEVTDGVSTVSPPMGKQWQLGLDQVATYKSEGHLFIRDGKVIIKMRPDFERSELTEPFWGFFLKDMGTAESAKKELTEILGKHGFETVKPVEIIKRLTLHVTKGKDTVLDFFAGSSTTAHAVMQLNAEDGGNRKFIMVQLPEPCNEKSEAFKAGYKNIAEISKERIRRAGKKILEGQTHEGWNKDVGFRVLKVDTSNMADVYYTPDSVKQNDLFVAVENIKPDRKPEDLLFQVLLDWGVDLSLSITKQNIQGKTVFFVNQNPCDLVACFDKGITEELVKEIAKTKPLRVVFTDIGFVSDSIKINAEQIFKQISPSTDIKAI